MRAANILATSIRIFLLSTNRKRKKHWLLAYRKGLLSHKEWTKGSCTSPSAEDFPSLLVTPHNPYKERFKLWFLRPALILPLDWKQLLEVILHSHFHIGIIHVGKRLILPIHYATSHKEKFKPYLLQKEEKHPPLHPEYLWGGCWQCTDT